MTGDEQDVEAWLPLWIGDYLADTMHLTAEHHGAYLLLIMHQWRKGPIPDDDTVLATIARLDSKAWRRVRAVLAPFFRIADGLWVQGRAEAEKARAVETRARIAGVRSAAGKAGAEARWKGKQDGNRNAMEDKQTDGIGNGNRIANGWQTDGSPPSPSDSPLAGETRARAPTPAGLACRAMKDAGIGDVNPSDVELLSLLNQGVNPDEFGDLAAELRSNDSTVRFRYVVRTMAGRRRDAAKRGTARSALPTDDTFAGAR